MELMACRSAIPSRYVTICYSQHSCEGIKIRFIHSLRVLERLHAELRPSHTEVPNAPNRQVECSTMPLQIQPFRIYGLPASWEGGQSRRSIYKELTCKLLAEVCTVALPTIVCCAAAEHQLREPWTYSTLYNSVPLLNVNRYCVSVLFVQ